MRELELKSETSRGHWTGDGHLSQSGSSHICADNFGLYLIDTLLVVISVVPSVCSSSSHAPPPRLFDDYYETATQQTGGIASSILLLLCHHISRAIRVLGRHIGRQIFDLVLFWRNKEKKTIGRGKPFTPKPNNTLTANRSVIFIFGC